MVFFMLNLALSTPKHYAYVQGTDKQIAEILEEVDNLIKAGIQELIFLAHDFSIDGPSSLFQILNNTLRSDQQFSLRLLYLPPEALSDELIGLIKRDARILPYLNILIEPKHLRTDSQQIISILSSLRSKIPHLTLQCSLMADMSSETTEQIQAFCTFITETQGYSVGIFPLCTPDDNEIAKARYKTLLEMQHKLVCKKNASLIGTQLDVLIEGYHPESRLLMRGRHDGQCPEIDGSVIINDGRKVTAFGKKYRVEITDVSDQDLIGRVI